MSDAPKTGPGYHQPTNREILERIDRLDLVHRERFERIESLLHGRDDASKGLVVRVDRLEQGEERKKIWTQLSLGAAITALVTAFADLMHGK